MQATGRSLRVSGSTAAFIRECWPEPFWVCPLSRATVFTPGAAQHAQRGTGAVAQSILLGFSFPRPPVHQTYVFRETSVNWGPRGSSSFVSGSRGGLSLPRRIAAIFSHTKRRWDGGQGRHMSIIVSAYWFQVSWSDLNRPRSLHTECCIAGRNLELREPESFIIGSKQCLPLPPKETLDVARLLL